MTVCCGQPLRELLCRAGLESVEGAFAYRGGQDLTTPWLGHRQRVRVSLTGADGAAHILYMKRYRREPLGWRIRRRLAQSGAASAAQAEAQAVEWVRKAGIATMELAAWGHQCGRSYIIVTQVPGEALEQCAESFLERAALRPGVRRQFVERLAELVRRLHGAGMAHRDLYSSHIFLHEQGERFELHLIDVARVFRPRWRRMRWFVKDLSQLRYSMPREWVADTWATFLDLYTGGERKRAARLDRATARKAARIARHDRRLRKRRNQEAIA